MPDWEHPAGFDRCRDGEQPPAVPPVAGLDQGVQRRRGLLVMYVLDVEGPYAASPAGADTPGCQNVVHLNHAGASLQPSRVTDTVVEHLRLEERIGGYEAGALDVEALERLVDARTRLIAITHVPTNGGLWTPSGSATGCAPRATSLRAQVGGL